MNDTDKPMPNAASFDVGRYPDGSGPMQRVRYDMNSPFCAENIWIDGGDHSDQWVAFNYRIAEELCVAIMSAARAIEAHLKGQP